MIDRGSKQYQEYKAAWELVRSPAWELLLKPQLESKATKTVRRPGSMDEMLEITGTLAEREFADSILTQIQRKAEKFSELK